MKYFAKLIGTWNGAAYVDHKMFLCSMDMKPNDKIMHIDGTQDVVKPDASEVGIALLGAMGYFKVIGEISPEANWVKEGDEFDESELTDRNETWISTVPFFKYKDEPKLSAGQKLRDQGIWKIAVKNSSCGHFH